MVESQDQCAVAIPDAAVEPSTEVDVEYDSEELAPTALRSSSISLTRPKLEYRRSSDMRTVGISVSKNARFRKDKTHARVRSSEKP